MNIKYVMDASAVIAVVLNEPYSAELPSLFMDSVITTVNLTEALTVLERKFNPDIELLWESVGNFIQAHYPVNQQLAKRVLEINKYTSKYGLSLGDKFCIALGMELKLPIYTADRVWKELESNLGLQINLIR